MFRTTIDDLSLFGGRTAGGPKPSFRPAVEALEERMVLSFTLASSFFGHGGTIPAEFASAGPYSGNWSPPLKWEDVPGNTVSFALIMDDVDVPSVADPKVKETFNHWVIFNIPANELSLRGAIPRELVLPDAAQQGLNGNGVLDLLEGKPVSERGIGYLGPNPQPRGSTHTYVFTLFALDKRLDLPANTTGKQQLLDAMGAVQDGLHVRPKTIAEGGTSILGEAVLHGSFNRVHYRSSGFRP
jgi:Raf kinase inhibitor-like YbhB/YbcL family protein